MPSLLRRRDPEAQIHRFATRAGAQPRQLTAAPADSARSGVVHRTRRSTSPWMGNDKAEARGVAADGRRGRDPDSSNQTLPCVWMPPRGLRRSASAGRQREAEERGRPEESRGLWCPRGDGGRSSSTDEGHEGGGREEGDDWFADRRKIPGNAAVGWGFAHI
jgi:hypothetical protein